MAKQLLTGSFVALITPMNQDYSATGKRRVGNSVW